MDSEGKGRDYVKFVTSSKGEPSVEIKIHAEEGHDLLSDSGQSAVVDSVFEVWSKLVSRFPRLDRRG